jgi:hypothetical protein
MQSSARLLEQWNRKLHFYLGLYFLFFLWLFSLTGLLLNHDSWATALHSNKRIETRYERSLGPFRVNTDTARAREVMSQLNMTGEISWPASQQAGYFAFNVSRPTEANQVRVDLTRNVASVQHFDNSGVAAFRIFHTFSGSRYADSSRRDWVLTEVWVAAMDALAIGLIVMVLGSYYMWFRLKQKRRLGALVLALGVASCAIFASGVL